MTPKKPALIRRREGNRGHRPIPDELRAVGVPREPKHLSPQQLSLWKEVVRSLPAGLLTRADEAVLERMAVAWGLYRDCCVVIAEQGLIMKRADGGSMRNPALLVQKAAAEEMHRCGTELGLSPVARTRLSPVDKSDDDPLRLLGEFSLKDDAPSGLN